VVNSLRRRTLAVALTRWLPILAIQDPRNILQTNLWLPQHRFQEHDKVVCKLFHHVRGKAIRWKYHIAIDFLASFLEHDAWIGVPVDVYEKRVVKWDRLARNRLSAAFRKSGFQVLRQPIE